MSWLWMAGALWAGFNAALLLVLWWRSVGENRKVEALIAELYADMKSHGPQWFAQAIEGIEGWRDT
jgi:hypothetical protein